MYRIASALFILVLVYSCKKTDTPANTNPSTLSFSVQVDVHIDGTSDVYQDHYHDSAAFRVDVTGMTVTMSKIYNQSPKVTPPSGSSATEAAVWLPDSIGVTNIVGEQLGLAYDSSNRKVVNILFTDSATITPSWQITDQFGTSVVDSAPVPGFPGAITFVSSDAVQVLKPLEGTGSVAQVTFTITPIH